MRRLTFIVMWIMAAIGSAGMIIGSTVDFQPTPTNLPETNAPPTATPRQFCRVQYLVFVHNSVGGVNVRPTPSINTTPIRVIRPADNPQRAIGLQDGWWQLCSIPGEYITADERYTIGITVTPQPATPTRISTLTEVPQPTRTSTPKPLGKSICIDYENDQGLQHVCGLFPLNARVVSIEVVTQEPTP